jgi:hypothetical protein
VKLLALALAALAAAGCMGGRSSSSGSGSAGTTSLEISVTLGGKDTLTKLWTLQCPTGATLPQPERACSRLDELDDPFGPVPKGVACTEIYGGPQVAEVRGTFRGEPVNTRFTRTNGCEIARWNSVRFLFPDT